MSIRTAEQAAEWALKQVQGHEEKVIDLKPETLLRGGRIWAALLAALVLTLTSPALAEPSFPPLTGRVVDAANIIPPDVEARLTQKLEALDTQSHRQVVVATLPSLQGYEISDYGYQLGRAWGIGSKEKNDGALLIVAPSERKVRIEVGYGLEGVLTDGLSSLIIQQQILPRFKAGDMPGGIEAGTDAIISQLKLPEDEARQIAAQARPQQAESDGGPIPVFFVLLFIFIFFVLPLLRARRGLRYASRGGPVVIWPGTSGGWSSGGGGWSSGGGGFSGGGGSFGGGGSSGSW